MMTSMQMPRKELLCDHCTGLSCYQVHCQQLYLMSAPGTRHCKHQGSPSACHKAPCLLLFMCLAWRRLQLPAAKPPSCSPGLVHAVRGNNSMGVVLQRYSCIAAKDLEVSQRGITRGQHSTGNSAAGTEALALSAAAALCCTKPRCRSASSSKQLIDSLCG